MKQFKIGEHIHAKDGSGRWAIWSKTEKDGYFLESVNPLCSPDLPKKYLVMTEEQLNDFLVEPVNIDGHLEKVNIKDFLDEN